MKANFLLRGRFGLWALGCLVLVAGTARAQGPTIDPTFQATNVAIAASARQVVQLPSGKRVLLGSFRQVGAMTSNGLVRLLAGSNQVDAVFQANTASLNVAEVDRLIALPNDQLLLFSQANNSLLTLGTVSRRGLLRLNADGTPDASFNTGTGPSVGVNDVVVQPDGKLLLAGAFTQFNGQTVNRLIRLNADGTLDATFQVSISNSNGQYAYINRVVLQPDGRLLLAGYFSTVQGQAVGLLARLLPAGTLDTSFSAPVIASGHFIAGMAVQPDAKILAAYVLYQGIGTPPPPLIRLLPDGTPDASFQTGTSFSSGFNSPVLPTQPVVVEPGGGILVATTALSYNGQPIGRVARLLPSGSLDTSFQTQQISGALYPEAPTSLQLLANGQLLTNYKLLNPTGTVDAGFDPQLKNPGQVMALALQPDGKLLVGGIFTEISGVAAGSLARLNPDGTPDAAFTTAAATNGIVYDLALQPDGKLLVGGDFTLLGGTTRQALGRLLPTGVADAAFASPIQPPPSALNVPKVRALAVQPDGNVLISGMFILTPGGGANASRTSARLLGSTGQVDASFAYPSAFNVVQFLVQPDGRIVVGGQGTVGSRPYALVQRLLPDGSPDPAFVTTPATVTFEAVRALQLDAAGRLYVGGQFTQFGSVPSSAVARLLPDGTPDVTFTTTLGSQSNVYALALQPNGRLLAGGALLTSGAQAHGSARLLPTGALDVSYTPTAGPDRPIFRLLVQPDGAIVAGGAFTSVNGSSFYTGLTRLLDPNVLSVASRHRPKAPTLAWPVPAHAYLHLALDAASRPQRVEVLDALGRVVLTQPTPQAELTLATGALPAGAYVLRVQYATGPVTRRVALE
ncbi:T9SS type A sorting domain-containing protein [Hymenobacter ruricola]|uniref:T9SS type A sorting domain-containing protein n=1 Tax=Hymenobacter ruricola TaxID=2791023 RepID=A0ABS0IC11_9BACT|nr:T9SS type A sorting domain-containing protein [Hymenobacter ruricola]MBF9224009.1 T9SS type A sorting domain-containing protein [Hymenobacter ruricola]